MKLLVIDSDGSGLDFCLRCQAWHHEVKWFVKKHANGMDNPVGRGLINKVGRWEEWMRWADLIFLTGNDLYLHQLSWYRDRGFPIFGPSLESAQLEIDRGFFIDLCDELGIQYPESHTFQSFDQCAAHILKSKGRFVFKTVGSEIDKSLSYVSKDAEDLLAWMDTQRKHGKRLKGECMLQEFVDGIEVGVSRWMGPQGWVGQYNENFEHKKLLPGNYGPNTGEMGTVMQYTPKSKLGKMLLDPMEDRLRDLGHIGDFDINVIVTDDGTPYVLEPTVRPGWPAFMIMQAEHKGDPLNWMGDLLDGKDTLEVSQEVAIGVVVAQPNFPYTTDFNAEAIGIPIRGIEDSNFDSIHLSEVMWGTHKVLEGNKLVSKPGYVTAGEYVCVVSGLGNTVRQASKRTYKVAKEIQIPNKIIRDDIGETLKDDLPELQKHGYCTQMEY